MSVPVGLSPQVGPCAQGLLPFSHLEGLVLSVVRRLGLGHGWCSLYEQHSSAEGLPASLCSVVKPFPFFTIPSPEKLEGIDMYNLPPPFNPNPLPSLAGLCEVLPDLSQTTVYILLVVLKFPCLYLSL